ncbi:hypothetical protein EJF36_05585 [Bacillus sp. HMF5848]|uniref:A24 family peptidase n=1 Tax=Bacillus sp. HMF5848 TaxID=2495421 RepID=UPI000F770E11|nr:prepilin peptidase [Bacillus sp. HMF5848]RSK26371.1 hypothetical protein EJF36_05585 [Bacillus sp. HMF5848]
MFVNVLLFSLVIICTYTDLKSRKIYNVIIFPTLLIALTSHLVTGGLSGFLSSLGGFAVGLAILLIPYFLGGMGAGDVKLLAVIGALKGTAFVLHTAIYMGLVGGVLAIFVLLFHKNIAMRLKVVVYKLVGVKIPLALGEDARKAKYPYGVAIAAGACMAFFFNHIVLINF